MLGQGVLERRGLERMPIEGREVGARLEGVVDPLARDLEVAFDRAENAVFGRGRFEAKPNGGGGLLQRRRRNR